MTIRVCRDPEFWSRVTESLGGRMGTVTPADIAALCAQTHVLPLASARGGFFFIRLDSAGFVCELHTIFSPDAWGTREITTAAKESFNAVFLAEYHMVVTQEVRANSRSQPPRSYGFVRAGDWRESALGEARMWVLTRAAWEASPANRRARNRLN